MEYNGVPLGLDDDQETAERARQVERDRAQVIESGVLNALADALLNEGEGEFGEGRAASGERRVETVETKMERRRDGEERW